MIKYSYYLILLLILVTKLTGFTRTSSFTLVQSSLSLKSKTLLYNNDCTDYISNDNDDNDDDPYDKFMKLLDNTININLNTFNSILLSDNKNIFVNADSNSDDDNSIIINSNNVMKLTDLKMISGRLGQ